MAVTRPLKWLGIAFAALVAIFLVAIAASVALIESQEVVVIRTVDGAGESRSTRVWVADHDGASWIAPGNRTNGWFLRLLENPRLELERAGVTRCYRATPVEGEAALAPLRVFLEKYQSVIRVTAFLNRLLEPAGDTSAPVAVRLDPC